MHNRLIHSIEVASVGRSIARIVARRLEREGAIGLDDIGQNEDVVEAACLMQDLVKQVANVFMDRYHSIMGGVEVVGGLIEHVPSKRELDCVKKLTVEFCYQESLSSAWKSWGVKFLGDS